jgi:hypothetical protein
MSIRACAMGGRRIRRKPQRGGRKDVSTKFSRDLGGLIERNFSGLD